MLALTPLPDSGPVNAMQPRASTAVAQRAALALAERALRKALPAGLDGYQTLLRCLEQGRTVDDATSALVDQAVGVWARPGFETLVSLPRLRFEPFAYQLQAAGTALRAMRGRAILADEVGLGKTIEAGLVASELRLRGLAARTLILVPVGLVEQWQQELDRKFGLPSGAGSEHGLAARDWAGGAAAGDRVAFDGAPGTVARRGHRDRLGSCHRGRGAPGQEPAERVGQAGARVAHPLLAAVDRDPGREPAGRPLPARQPGPAGASGHAQGVPRPLRFCEDGH